MNSPKRRSTIKMFAMSFALCTSLTLASNIMPQPAYASVDAFYNAGFIDCDAQLLAAYWNMGFSEAKAEAGVKILTIQGGKNNVRKAIKAGRKVGKCTWEYLGLSYEDAEFLGKVWGVDANDAKVKAENYYTKGKGSIVTELLSGD